MTEYWLCNHRADGLSDLGQCVPGSLSIFGPGHDYLEKRMVDEDKPLIQIQFIYRFVPPEHLGKSRSFGQIFVVSCISGQSYGLVALVTKTIKCSLAV